MWNHNPNCLEARCKVLHILLVFFWRNSRFHARCGATDFEALTQLAEKTGAALDFGWRSGLPLR
jgi:hypothetical protein